MFLNQYKVALPRSSLARLFASPIHGVGVVAIADIPGNACIFPGDDGVLKLVAEDELKLAHLSQDEWRLYADFCVFMPGFCGCPPDFGKLSLPWYVNHASGAEVNATYIQILDGYFLYSERDINKGEEILVNYRQHAETPWAWLLERAGN